MQLGTSTEINVQACECLEECLWLEVKGEHAQSDEMLYIHGDLNLGGWYSLYDCGIFPLPSLIPCHIRLCAKWGIPQKTFIDIIVADLITIEQTSFDNGEYM